MTAVVDTPTGTATAPGFLVALRGAAATYLRRPAPWVLVGIWLLQIVIFAYVVNAAVYQGSTDEALRDAVGRNLTGELAAVWPLGSMPMYGAPVFVILGALASASDYRYGTLRLVLTRFGSRTQLLLARWACVALMSAVVSGLTLAVAFPTSALVSRWLGLPPSTPALGDVASAFGVGALIIATLATIGFVAGVLTRSALGAVLGGAGWVIGVEVLLLAMLTPAVAGLATVRGVLPAGAAGSVAASLAGDAGVDLAATLGVAELVPPAAAVAVMCGWTVLGLVVALLLFRRRDV